MFAEKKEEEKMKKLMALVLAMIMLVSFAGCGGNNEVAEEGKAEARPNAPGQLGPCEPRVPQGRKQKNI